MTLDMDELLTELRRIRDELGDEWSLANGTDRAYGANMHYVGLRNPGRGLAVRVWWFGSEVRLSAVLGVPYEASDEIVIDSVTDIGSLVLALCAGHYVRRDSQVVVTTDHVTARLTEWPDDALDPSDPWP